MFRNCANGLKLTFFQSLILIKDETFLALTGMVSFGSFFRVKDIMEGRKRVRKHARAVRFLKSKKNPDVTRDFFRN